jgi:hypothetical protein
MPIYVGSRFEALKYSVVEEADGTQKRFMHLRIPNEYTPKRTHELLPRQQLDFLAYRYTGQARQWWKFAEANDLFWPLDLDQGTKLKVPS